MIEVLTIGNEILSGKVVNTNLSFIAKTLKSYGYQVRYHSAISDQISTIKQSLQEALSRADIVIVTGGLGPTLDDLTKHACAEFFDKKCFTDEKLKEDLLNRYKTTLTSAKEQATIPEDTKIMFNLVGTAPGFIFAQGDKRIYILPGVPSEMEVMFLDHAMPDIIEHFPIGGDFFRKTYYFCHLGENDLDPLLRKLQNAFKQLEIGIYPGYGVLCVELFSKNNLTAEHKKQIEEAMTQEFGSYIYSFDNSSLALALQKKLTSNHQTLFLAESCTGGKIAAHIVSQPGASNYFLGSGVVYSDLMKEKVLGVSPKSLKECGSVSFEVINEMLEGALRLSGADYVLAVSGIAGPEGGSEDKPVGLVICGLLDKKGHKFIWKIQAKGRGKRENVIEYTAQYILGALWRYIVHHINPK